VDSIFVVLLDADDRIGSNYLFATEKLLRAGCDVANPDAIVFGERSGRWWVPETTTLQMLLRRNTVHCCAAFRRCYWAQIGGLDEGMDHWADYDFWIRMARAGARIHKVPGDHFYYRKHGPSKSSVSALIRESLRERIRQKHRDVYAVHPPRIAADKALM
jgi:O-antigen biosynthesis protein